MSDANNATPTKTQKPAKKDLKSVQVLSIDSTRDTSNESSVNDSKTHGACPHCNCGPIGRYVSGMLGERFHGKHKPIPSAFALIRTWLGSFLGILLLATLTQFGLKKANENTALVGAFGAEAVLLFAASQLPPSQPRNAVLGNVLGAIIGVSCQFMLPASWFWLKAPLAVSLTISMQQVTKSVHPPGGAMALIAVLGPERIYNLGFLYILSPALLGTLLLLAVGLLVNNCGKRSSYPKYWI